MDLQTFLGEETESLLTYEAKAIPRDELVLPGEFSPELEIGEGTRSPLIGADVFTKSHLVHRAHGGSLRRRARDHGAKENRGNGRARYR